MRRATTLSRLATATVLLLSGAACLRTAPPPSVTDQAQAVPDLRGARVMLYPVQLIEGLSAQVDAELAFALDRRNAGVDWVRADQMRRASATSPGLDAKLEGLPVSEFMRVEVSRVGDPLFGYLRRMGALVDADIALIPVLARFRPESPADPGSPPGTPVKASGVEIAAALLNIRSGQVLWFGMVGGTPGAADDPRALTSAAEALSRRILPFLGSSPR